jgi:hypothetical protein
MKQICTIWSTAVNLAVSEKRIKNLCVLLLILPYFSWAQSGSNNKPQFIPELIFQNPVLTSGTDKQEGAIYRFSNVATGIDALLEIKKISDNATAISELDKPDMGWKKAFQPQLGRSGTVSAYQNWWIRFHITFVESATEKKVVLSKFYVTALDVDGDNLSIQEYVQMQNADSIKFSTTSYLALSTPINCGLTNTTKDKLTQGPVTNFTDIDTAATAVMATYTYLNTSDLDFTIGGKSGAAQSTAGLRLNSLWFKSFSLAPKLTTLPLRLISFQGNFNNNKVNLQWTVAQNETGTSFELEKSLDGSHFSTDAYIFTTDKTGTENYYYKETIDRTSYYRLKMINKDNSITYSKIIKLAVENGAGNGIKILQNPVSTSLQLSYHTSISGSAAMNIYTASGLNVLSTQLQSQKGTNSYLLNLDPKITKGLYVLEIINGTEKMSTRFIKE